MRLCAQACDSRDVTAFLALFFLLAYERYRRCQCTAERRTLERSQDGSGQLFEKPDECSSFRFGKGSNRLKRDVDRFFSRPFCERLALRCQCHGTPALIGGVRAKLDKSSCFKAVDDALDRRLIKCNQAAR